MGVSWTSLSEIECVFGGPRLSLFDCLFWLGWCFSKKNNAFPNAINIRVLEHLGAPDAAFLQRFQSVDFTSKHGPKRYIYNGFSDLSLSEKRSLWKDKYGFFDSIRVRPKIAQVLRI